MKQLHLKHTWRSIGGFYRDITVLVPLKSTLYVNCDNKTTLCCNIKTHNQTMFGYKRISQMLTNVVQNKGGKDKIPSFTIFARPLQAQYTRQLQGLVNSTPGMVCFTSIIVLLIYHKAVNYYTLFIHFNCVHSLNI